jgi:hypothetical protein
MGLVKVRREVKRQGDPLGCGFESRRLHHFPGMSHDVISPFPFMGLQLGFDGAVAER